MFAISHDVKFDKNSFQKSDLIPAGAAEIIYSGSEQRDNARHFYCPSVCVCVCVCPLPGLSTIVAVKCRSLRLAPAAAIPHGLHSGALVTGSLNYLAHI